MGVLSGLQGSKSQLSTVSLLSAAWWQMPRDQCQALADNLPAMGTVSHSKPCLKLLLSVLNHNSETKYRKLVSEEL